MSMENSRGYNFETVIEIQFKRGTGIDHPSGITLHDFIVNSSEVKFTTLINVSNIQLKLASALYWAVLSSQFFGTNMRTTPKSEGQMDATETTVAVKNLT